ncbi:Holliday junction branch migration protein RuvA [Gloeobacter kilaueensis]|uniref:Holliday junction branch migration complex subunit RuvA n=1 Tax=Gloeobacter kilaueensis (strain ATCC BAA-2537 / CCAP 1431/1 / ULC 316 / JS1) TaxID=1183438 RepID=U5QFF6_GLOK1|nr:Holliday junction branch migration protein RuvA [Gloeobacter kilaueensis]AGY56319.1 Holliday junction DNA helicase RuvA [Gloeobacter kilaueensis JS1]
MISFLRGQLVEVGPRSGQSWATLEVGGVGYRVWIHARTVRQLPRIGEEVKLFTAFIVREDAMQLFGFLEASERELFDQLISVSGIGPRMGLALLETLAPTELVQAILQGNTRALALAPGIGAKTAQRLALELRTRLSKWREEAGIAAVGAKADTRIYAEVEMALLALGFAPNETVKALDAIAPALAEEQQTEVWLRSAISWLSEER